MTVTELQVHPRVLQQGIAQAAAQRVYDTARPKIFPFREHAVHSTVGVLDWDHRLPSKQLTLRVHVLYDGEARTIKDRKPIGKFAPGDFFGEINLLQTSAASADVESKEDSRCLLINRVEFIRFLSRNHHVALQMERLCSHRLGRPIFPLSRESFDVR